MLNINFVPEDYTQNNESNRTNFLYLVLFAVVMAGLGGAFFTIKMRQRVIASKEEQVNAKMVKAQEAIRQFEELQNKRKSMMKRALTTAELIEPVPRSVLLACLTNNLPDGVSLLKLNIVQQELKNRPTIKRKASQYKTAKADKSTEKAEEVSTEKLLRTYIDIEGIAGSDLEVANYITRLDNSNLIDNVTLMESKEDNSKSQSKQEQFRPSLRQFKLTAMLAQGTHLSKEDMNKIRAAGKKSANNF
ncbi:PilN domain-containing protein [Planctomycetota bacterium]